MTETTCESCGARTPDGVICWTCAGRVRDVLDALVRVLPELWTTAAGLSSKEPGGGRSTGHGPGIHVDALDVAGEVSVIVRAVARDLTDSRVPRSQLPARSGFAAHDVVSLVRFLRDHVADLRQHPAAAEWLDELTRSASAVWLDPATGQRVTFTRPPLVEYVLGAIDRHRDPAPLSAGQLARARDAADAWVTVPVLMSALPMLLPGDVDPPNRSTIYEWINGRKATDKRRAVLPRLFKSGSVVRVGSVLDLIAERDAARHADRA